MSRGKMEGIDIIHPMRRFRCFVFDLQLKLRSSHASKPKRKTRLCHYVCVRPPLYFSKAKTGCKGNAFYLKRQNIFLKICIKNTFRQCAGETLTWHRVKGA